LRRDGGDPPLSLTYLTGFRIGFLSWGRRAWIHARRH